MSRNSVFLSSRDRNLGDAFKVHPGSQASSRVEAKNLALLSSYNGDLLEPIEWPNGSQASCGVLREDSGLPSRPCRKRRALSGYDTGFLRFYSSCGATCGVALELRRGTQGASRVALGKSSLHSSVRGCAALLSSHGRGIRPQDALKGKSRGFSQFASENSGFPRLVTITSGSFSWCLWEYRNTVELEGPLDLLWGRCIGRGPHLVLRL